MKKERTKRINELIKEELAKIILKEIEFPTQIFVTLTRVETSKNNEVCKVFVSCFPEEKWPKIKEILEKEITLIQRALNKKLVMKKIPKIFFKKEKTLIEAEKIEKILEKLKKEKN